MIYYLINILKHHLIASERDSFFSEAGKKRTDYVVSTMDEKVEIISLALPNKRGYFKSENQEINSKLTCYYPFSLNYINLKYVSILLNILSYLLFKIKKGDLIVCYNANIMYVIPIIICKLFKKNKLVYEIEELYSTENILKGIRHYIMRFTENYMLKNADAYIVVSEKTKEKINTNKPAILNFGYGIDESSLTSNVSKEKIIVYSGRLDYEGGIELFIEALELITQKVTVIVTGKGPLEENIEKINFMNKNIDVHFLGFVKETVFNEIMNSATICINPLRLSSSYSEYSFPSKVLMYLSYGNNVISSMSKGILPLASQFDNLYTYDEDSASVLAEKIEEVLLLNKNKKENLDNVKNFFENQKKELCEFWKVI